MVSGTPIFKRAPERQGVRVLKYSFLPLANNADAERSA
jgi:hypothetical protein